MQVEDIVNTLYEYIVNNNFNGFYDYLVEKFKNSSDENCNLIVEIFLKDINYQKFYNMYAPVVISALDKELGKRKTISFDSYKKLKEEEEITKSLENPILVNIRKHLYNRDLESFRESLLYLINEIKNISELKETFSSVARLIESIRDDNLIYEQSKQIFAEIRNTSTLWQEEFQRLNKFIDKQELDNNNNRMAK